MMIEVRREVQKIGLTAELLVKETIVVTSCKVWDVSMKDVGKDEGRRSIA